MPKEPIQTTILPPESEENFTPLPATITEKGTQQAIAVPDQSNLPVDVVRSNVEQYVQNVMIFRHVVAKLIDPSHWCFFGDKPYFGTGAAEKLLMALGISIHITSLDPNTGRNYFKSWSGDQSAYYITYNGTASRGDVSIDVMGQCSSNKAFYASDSVELDETKIVRDAYSNLITNAVGILLGFKHMDKDTLIAIYGAEAVAKMKRVEFGKRGESSQPTAPAPAGSLYSGTKKNTYDNSKCRTCKKPIPKGTGTVAILIIQEDYTDRDGNPAKLKNHYFCDACWEKEKTKLAKPATSTPGVREKVIIPDDYAEPTPPGDIAY